ncbi:MAG TPA: hypothetical protein VMY59_04820 [Candidatus Thermoplasmatota archaeon]|nr:hypothetical protein [Candidatus Thermoplasmatota archaeon]
MIFISKNEKGEPAWRLIQEGRKRVTRRLKPVTVGKILAVQPGRGKKAVGYIRVLSCINSFGHFNESIFILNPIMHRCFNMFIHCSCPTSEFSSAILDRWKQSEATEEGFESWDGLMQWLMNHKIQIHRTFRIEFEYIGEEKKP